MRKNKKSDILLLKFKLIYRAIFLNSKFLKITKNHFDSKLGFACFVIGLIHNQTSKQKTIKHIEINFDEWITMLCSIYLDEDIKKAYAELSLNPIISLENIEKSFDCFDNVVNKIIQFIMSEQLDIKINEHQLKYIFKSCFGFIMYNCIDCKINYSLKDILSDQEYDQKYIQIVNNTKLFANAKKSITDNCNYKISDLITLILGISNNLNYDK